MKEHRLILASGSPRRKMLLESAGLHPEIEVSSFDESHIANEGPAEYVARMAREKGHCVSRHHEGEDTVVLSADTIVVHNGKILGKPANETEAFEMLSQLSADLNTVMTGVSLIDTRNHRESNFVVQTKVYFTKLSERQIRAYISTGEPMDKAGAYGIQGGAAGFVERIEGSYTNVVGLPLCETLKEIEKYEQESMENI